MFVVWKGQRFTHGLPQLSSGSGRSGISRLGVVVVVFLGDAFDRDGRAVLADFDFLRPALAEVDEVLAGALVLLGASSVVETVFVGVVDEAVRTLGASDSVAEAPPEREAPAPALPLRLRWSRIGQVRGIAGDGHPIR